MAVPDSKTRFSNRVADYVKYRPRYPQAVIDLLRQHAGLTPAWAIADVGSGTGISAELFLASGNAVYAVEPNADMRAAAEAVLGDRPGFQSVDGTAEATGLAPASVELVTAAQAYHWFDHAAFALECRRIIRPGGWFAAMWNQRSVDESAFQRDYDAVLHRFGTDYAEVSRKWAMNVEHFTGVFGVAFQRLTAANHQEFDFDGLKGRVLSSSYAPAPGQANHEPMMAALQEIFDRHQQGGQVRVDYTTEIFIGQIG